MFTIGIFDESSGVRCVTAGDDLVRARATAPCVSRADLRDVVVCSVEPARAEPGHTVVRIGARVLGATFDPREPELFEFEDEQLVVFRATPRRR